MLKSRRTVFPRAFAAIVTAALSATSALSATLRVVTYNIDDDTGGSSGHDARVDYSKLGVVLQGIGNHHLNGNAQPIDVLALEELHYDNPSTSSSLQNVVNQLNTIYGAGTYAFDPYVGDTTGNSVGNGPNGLIYNTHTVTDLGASGLTLQADGTTPLVSGTAASRQPIRYELRPVGYAANENFYLYVSHYKAQSGTDNANRRNIEAQAIRADADSLGSAAHVIYSGDFNLTGGSNEAAYQSLIAPGNGQAIDPLNATGWANNSNWTPILTEAADNLTARFDFQLVSNATVNQSGMQIIPGSYQAFGNASTMTYSGAVNDPTNTQALTDLANRTTVLNDLADLTVSDHLPVIADYQTVDTTSTTIWAGGTGNWSNGSMWVGGTFPNGPSVMAAIDDGNATASVVTLDTTVSVGGVLLDSGDALTISPTRTLTVNGLVTSEFAGTFTNSGTLVVAGGTARLLSGGIHTGTFSVAASSTLEFGADADTTVSGLVSGSGALLKTGTGTLAITSDSNYSGGTTISAGVLSLGNGGTAGSVTGNIVDNAQLTFNRSNNYTCAGVISGTGNVTKLGAGNVTLTGANTYTGTTTINGGTLTISSDANLGNGGALSFDGGTLVAAVGITSGRAITLNAGGATFVAPASTLVLNGTISGAGGLTKSGSATSALTLSGSNSFNGGVLLTSGRVNFNNNNAAGTGTISVQGTTSDLTCSSGPVSLANAISLASGADLRAYATSGNTLTLAGVISGSGAMHRDDTGAGTLVLSGSNSFSGGFTISSRTLTIANKSALGSGTFSIGSGSAPPNTISIQAGTALTGANAIGNAISANQDFTLSGSNDVEFSGPVALGSSTRTIGVTSSGATIFSGPISGSGGITKLNSGTLTFSGNNNYTGATTVSAGKLLLASNLTTSSSVFVAGGTIELSTGASNNRLLKTSSVSVTSGKIDLKDNKMIVAGGSVGSWDGMNYDGITGLIKSGRNAGNWSGTGIVTSMTAAISPHTLTTLGVATAGAVGKTTFAGQSVSPTDVLVMYTYTGDANLDGKINADDYFQIDSHYNKSDNASKSYFNGDFNYDGLINGDDYALIDASFAAQTSVFSAPPLAGVTSVPEPAGAIFALTATTALLRRRRRI